MKKMILMLAIIATTMSAFAGKPTVAAGEENVNPKVLDAFKAEFSNAKEVKWAAGENYYSAAFVYNDKYLFAFYNTEGELLGLTRNISPVDLPLSLQKDLKDDYKNYWISGLYEVANSKGTTYYITLENADTKLILNADNTYKWSSYKKEKKA